jgi:predicted site-specific integrase-resolvase
MKVNISKAAQELGVHPETLRRWEIAGKIQVERTPRGHRRYDLAKLKGLIPNSEGIARSRFGIELSKKRIEKIN